MFNNNYFKIAWRNICKTKLYSVLNIVGLSVGILGVILIFLYTYNEINYDSYHKNKDRIYRISSHFNIDGKDSPLAISSYSIGYLFNEDYPEVENFVRLRKVTERSFLKHNDNKHYVERVYFADTSVLDIFTHEFVYGTKETALSNFESIMLSESVSRKIFGNNNPIGEVVYDITQQSYIVTGVFKDFPDNTHLKYDVIMPYESAIERVRERAGDEAVNPYNPQFLWQVNLYTYILLSENADIQSLLEKSEGFFDKYMSDFGKQLNATFRPIITPLKDVHFSNLQWDEPQGRKEYIYIFIIVSIFLITIASINYMNLATARSMKRAKEVGIRKVLGAQKGQLIKQFLAESVLISIISLFFSMVLTELFLPTFNRLIDKQLSFGFSAPLIIYILLFATVIVIGLVSGIYPAFFMSSYQPASVLKGEISKSKKAGFVRKILVVFQYSLSMIMILSTLVVLKQINYIRTADIGFNKDNVMIIRSEMIEDYQEKFTSFRQDLINKSGIVNISTANSDIFSGYGMMVFDVHNEGNIHNIGFNFIRVAPDFFELLEIDFVEGGTFDSIEGKTTEATFKNQAPLEYIVNESAFKLINGYNKINFSGNNVPGTIIGVVRDFNYASLHNPIEPLIFAPVHLHMHVIYIKISDYMQVDFIRERWTQHFHEIPFEYSFLDYRVQEMYMAEVKLSQVFTYFAIMCILISCLGIIGLAVFSTQQRTKEIGIRKIHGASKLDIVKLLNSEFIKLVNIAAIIGTPVAIILMRYWLQGFEYSIKFPYYLVLISFVIVWVIAWCTVSLVTYNIAKAKPVDAIRYE